MIDQILNTTSHPLLIAVLIVVATWVLEDAAIISAALLSIDGFIGPLLAFLALFIGIFSGDLGLYGLGRMLAKWPLLSRQLNRWFSEEKISNANEWLRQRMVYTVLTVRVIPGLRLPSYLACGYFNYSFQLFAGLVLMASLVWTGILFFALYWFGSMFWSELSAYKWFLLPLFVLGIVFLHKRIQVSR
ncbi:DedA family protein [Endozoicomonas ascidiicola]|uniref:DedA family protein n=1 Tax=Endozoicomonas ascidiicola TaxID=1698521 RepID=UPI00083359BF|nr:VTT domain-containing protein [Endozoicomonas ascidiicola]